MFNYVGGYVRPRIVIDLKTNSGRGLLTGRWEPGHWPGSGASSVLGLSLRAADRTLTSAPSTSEPHEEPGCLPSSTALQHAVLFLCRTPPTCGPWWNKWQMCCWCQRLTPWRAATAWKCAWSLSGRPWVTWSRGEAAAAQRRPLKSPEGSHSPVWSGPQAKCSGTGVI